MEEIMEEEEEESGSTYDNTNPLRLKDLRLFEVQYCGGATVDFLLNRLYNYMSSVGHRAHTNVFT